MNPADWRLLKYEGGDRINILVVDDEPYVAGFMTSVLDSAGHKAEFVLNGIEATEKLRQQPFDLVFSDMRMPEMNGEDLFGWMRVECPDTRRVLVTGLPDIENRLDQMKADGLIEGYLIKPFKVQDLMDVASKVGGPQ